MVSAVSGLCANVKEGGRIGHGSEPATATEIERKSIDNGKYKLPQCFGILLILAMSWILLDQESNRLNGQPSLAEWI